MEEVLSVEIFNGNVTKKSDAHHLFKIDPSKIDRIYEMLIKKGIAQSWYYLILSFIVVPILFVVQLFTPWCNGKKVRI